MVAHAEGRAALAFGRRPGAGSGRGPQPVLALLNSSMLALLLAGFAGFFFYLGALDLLPESQRMGQRVQAGLATLLGAGLLYAVAQAV